VGKGGERDKGNKNRTEKKVWKYINRERKQKESVSEEITTQEWEEWFMKLLEGRGRNTNEGETDGARGNRNHSGRESLEKVRRLISGGK
jgi:hypothetical protein